MPALRTLGLVIMTALAVSIGILGYVCMRAVSDERAARSAANEVAGACGDVISIGGVQNVTITIPGSYRMRFVENQIAVDSYRVPEHGFVFEFSENSPELGPGTHNLSVSIQDGRLVVTRI